MEKNMKIYTARLLVLRFSPTLGEGKCNMAAGGEAVTSSENLWCQRTHQPLPINVSWTYMCCVGNYEAPSHPRWTLCCLRSGRLLFPLLFISLMKQSPYNWPAPTFADALGFTVRCQPMSRVSDSVPDLLLDCPPSKSCHPTQLSGSMKFHLSICCPKWLCSANLKERP